MTEKAPQETKVLKEKIRLYQPKPQIGLPKDPLQIASLPKYEA